MTTQVQIVSWFLALIVAVLFAVFIFALRNAEKKIDELRKLVDKLQMEREQDNA